MSAGCGKPKPATPETTVMVGTMSGPIILDVPADYDPNKAYPLITVWHGAGVTNTAFHGYLNVQAVAGKDAIIVTPECLDGSSWPQDPSYFDAILEHFEASYCIDKKRVFSTGHSMGGMHTALLGCQRADKLRGDAVLAFGHNASNCVKGDMAAMMSVGQSDFAATAATEFTYWAMYGGCDANMKMPVDPMSFYKGALDESGTCTDYGGCNPKTPVRTCTFDGGHEIPPWVAGAVWAFFKKL
jgi:poly(3-hydroxybutyrate) depolymerase